MRNDALSIQSMEFAVSVIRLVKCLKEQQDNYFKSDRQSGISIGANIREAQYEHGKSDFIAKLQIALKEASGTDYWFELLLETEHIDAETYERMDVLGEVKPERMPDWAKEKAAALSRTTQGKDHER